MKINRIICISFLVLMTFISCENHEFISENISEKKLTLSLKVLLNLQRL